MEMINMQQYPLDCSYKMQINKIGCLYFISLLFEADKHLQNYGKYRENADTATLTADRQTERSWFQTNDWTLSALQRNHCDVIIHLKILENIQPICHTDWPVWTNGLVRIVLPENKKIKRLNLLWQLNSTCKS